MDAPLPEDFEQPDEQAEPIQVDWDQHPAPSGGDQPPTVAEAMLPLMAAGVPQQTLTDLHDQGFTPDTPADQVPTDMWTTILHQLSPTDLASLAQVNHFFHQLVFNLGLPLGDANDPAVVHVYTDQQLTTATTMPAITWIAVHAGVNPAHIGATATSLGPILLLGPGVTATDISGGHVAVYQGGTVTGISGGEVTVNAGGTATGISGGTVVVEQGGTATGISGGTVVVEQGGTATGISGGTVVVEQGGAANSITGGTVHVEKGGTATDITGGEVYIYAGGDATGITGGEIYDWIDDEWEERS